ncbi:MAG: hypothetical protein K2X72_26210 [Reyranella sp.]|nr:hypothetical protein [Reyranella sp.]
MTGKQIVALVVGAIIGIAGLRYVGPLVLIPALSVAACWWIFTRLGLHPRLVLPLAVAGGHGIWFLIGTVMTLAAGGSAQTLLEGRPGGPDRPRHRRVGLRQPVQARTRRPDRL